MSTLRRDLERVVDCLSMAAPEDLRTLSASLKSILEMLEGELVLLDVYLAPYRVHKKPLDVQHKALDARATLQKLIHDCQAVRLKLGQRETPDPAPPRGDGGPGGKSNRTGANSTTRAQKAIVRSPRVVEAEFVEDQPRARGRGAPAAQLDLLGDGPAPRALPAKGEGR